MRLLTLSIPFFITGEFQVLINTTWITLIPKKHNPCSIEDYMPISVVGCLYKIVSKVLANKLKPVVGEVISDIQSGFIQGSCILDNILIANKEWSG